MADEKKHRVWEFLEGVANFAGLAGGIPAIAGRLSKVWGAMPPTVQEQVSQKVPGFMGLSTKDEEIFNALLPKLKITEEKMIVDFLDTCQEFQLERLILIVSGMEVVQGTPQTVEKKWNEKAKAFEEKITLGKESEDSRLKFLKRFAAYIKKYGPDEAYKRCTATRMMHKTSTLQSVKHSLGAGGKEIAEQARSAKRSLFDTEERDAAIQSFKESLERRMGRK